MRTACATHSALITGSMPGIAASTSETWLLGSPPNAVEAPENSFDFEATWACTSRPMTTSQSPVAPAMRFFEATLLGLSCMGCSLPALLTQGGGEGNPRAGGAQPSGLYKEAVSSSPLQGAGSAAGACTSGLE